VIPPRAAAQDTDVSAALLEALRAENAKLKAECEQLREVCKRHQAELAASQAMLAKMEAARDAEMARGAAARDNEAAKFQDALAALDAARQQIAVLHREVDALRKELAEVRAGRAMPEGAPAEEPPEEPVPDKPRPNVDRPPAVTGEITAVAGNGIVEISLGSDDGLEVGHRLHVIRMTGDQGIYVGRIEIAKTAKSQSAARSLPDCRALRKGDRVTTELR
jgi:hypothetical protein